jgi:carbon-monoxide dehydrogenase large subunit
MEPVGGRSVGMSVKRVEDPRILTGQGNYVDDIVVPGMLHAAFLRSQVPHGRLLSLDVSEARALPGVVAVYTGEDLQRLAQPAVGGAVSGFNLIPGMNLPTFHALATDKVRHVGDPIALVVAEDRYLAEDAIELIVEDIDMLDAVVTYADAVDPDKPLLFDELGSNVNLTMPTSFGDIEAAFAKADRVVRASIQVHRHAPVPMEGRGAIASWDAEPEHLTLWATTQSPHMYRMALPAQVGIPMEKIRVLTGDVGGGFGLKNSVGREEVALVVAAKDLGRPVKWIEDRFEHLAASGQAREEMADVEAAITDDGHVLGVRLDVKVNLGAYPAEPFPGSMQVMTIPRMFQGPAKLEALEATATALYTNKAAYVAYRGPWATADFLRERLLDLVAAELGMDPLDVRRRNYVVRDEPPLAMFTGQPYTAVTTQESVEQAAALVDWAAFRERQRAAREEGRYLGVGMASYLEPAPGPKVPGQSGMDLMGEEVAHLSVDRDGRLVVITRQQPHGQGHETTIAQVAADEFGVALEDVVVRFGDTDITPVTMIGTGGSRAATMASGATLHGSRALKAKMLDLAAEVFEASAADLDLVDGVVSVRGTPTVRLELAELARIVAEEPERLGDVDDPELKVTHSYDGGQSGWSGGTHCCIVEVDVETGLVDIERYLVVEDCGLAVNPAIVDGQIRGGVAQGVGAVLLEHAAYDEDGQVQAATFMDYLMPTTTTVPRIEVHHVEAILTDPDVNFRGVGEGGFIVSPATIVSAIEDALAPFGARITEQHLPPARILELAGTVPPA